MRLTVDYRKLNEVIEPDAFPIPRIDDTLERLAGAKFFFHIVRFDQWILADASGGRRCGEDSIYDTLEGLFETPVLPMGLKKMHHQHFRE